ATVPSAITLLDLARFGEVVSAAGCGPVDGTWPASGSRTRVRLSSPTGGAAGSAGTNRGAWRGVGESYGWKDGCGEPAGTGGRNAVGAGAGRARSPDGM